MAAAVWPRNLRCQQADLPPGQQVRGRAANLQTGPATGNKKKGPQNPNCGCHVVVGLDPLALGRVATLLDVWGSMAGQDFWQKESLA